jgi:hypothetical protein
VGKTTVAYAVSARLRELGVPHCHVEGDNLDAVYPKPLDDPRGTRLTEANLAALWHNYAHIGVRKLIYTNTMSVLESAMVVRAVGGAADVVAVLLTGADTTVEERLRRRENGTQLTEHLDRSAVTAPLLEDRAAASVHRVSTDARSPVDVAAEVLRLSRWV